MNQRIVKIKYQTFILNSGQYIYFSIQIYLCLLWLDRWTKKGEEQMLIDESNPRKK